MCYKAMPSGGFLMNIFLVCFFSLSSLYNFLSIIPSYNVVAATSSFHMERALLKRCPNTLFRRKLSGKLKVEPRKVPDLALPNYAGFRFRSITTLWLQRRHQRRQRR